MAGRDSEPDVSLLPPVRAAIEVRSLDRGGLETVVAELLRSLPALGIEPVLICTERGGELADELRREGRAVEVLTAADRRAEIEALLVHHGVDVWNAHYSTIGAPLAAARGIPVVVTLHNAYAWLGAGVLDEVRSVDPHVALYVAVSQSVADFTAHRFGIDRRRIAVVRNGVRARGSIVDAEARARRREELGIDRDAELVVQIASVNRVKCQLALVDAVALLRDSRPRLTAWLVGPVAEEDYADLVRRRISEARLEDRVRLVGAREDVGRILEAADVFALPSVVEGLSLAAVEAMAAGVPVVLTRTGDAEFLLGDSGIGGGPSPGVLIDGPRLEPWAVNWMSLRELAGAEHPAHAPALARGIGEVLDTIGPRREAAGVRGAEIARLLIPEAMVRETASLLLRVVADRALRRCQEMAALLASEQAANAALHASLASVSPALAELRDRVTLLQSDVRVTSELQARTIAVATRTLDKLRLKDRAQKALRSLKGRVLGRWSAPGARAPPEEPAPGPRGEAWIILAVVPYDDIGGGQRSAQLARALAARGHHVTYVARFPRSESRDLEIAVDVPGIELVDWDADAVGERLRACDDRLRVLVEAPEEEILAVVRDAARVGARVLYDKIDHWEACAWADWYRPEVEAALVDAADDLTASADLLARQIGAGGRPVHLLPNAVDRGRFSVDRPTSVPVDLVRGDVTLVYAGSLWGDWFDWDLVVETARARAGWAIALIGDPPPRVPLELPPNVHLLGLKNQATLPAYYAAADACLIPFRRTPVTDGVNPLKVYEYLAMHRPVVATQLPEIHDLPYVFWAVEGQSAARAVETAIATPAPSEEIERFLARNSWHERAARLSEIVAQPTIAVIVLCYNNRDVIGRCVDSLVHHRGGHRYEIVVVDNGSNDGSIDLLSERARHGEITLLRNSQNGCSSGRNLGIARTRSEIVVFVDSDQWALADGWLDPALAILRDRREIGAVAWNGGWFDAKRGPGATVDNLPERGMVGRWAGAPYRTDVAYLATSGLALPRSVLERTRGFDEAFDPTCYEDTDLSFQIKEIGYDLAYCPALGVGHRPHQTTGSLDNYRDLLARNGRYFLDKWRDRPEFFFDVPAAD
jgi:glycosyltransferase involved in cell wall biosynthesis/GT2 family glycosyltransferase